MSDASPSAPADDGSAPIDSALASDAASGADATSVDAPTPGAEGGSPEATVAAPPFEAGSPVDTSGIAPMTWTFVPIDGAMCRDGSATGIGLNLNPASKQLVIYLEGGGACFNSSTCSVNPSSFGMSDFASHFASSTGGLLDRTDPGSPVQSWNYVYVPYCTGDVHAGSARDKMVAGVGVEQFVG